jgi:aerobic-type carbon monoxide dehydrogenase small subunit (CoxS/CutS family)
MSRLLELAANGEAREVTAVVLHVNGSERRVEAPRGESLLAVLRDRLQPTGTKYGCGEGQCGACTVLLDGRVARSCRVAVAEAAGKKITTIEGLAQADGRLHPMQAAFLEVEAFQCGYCTPGMIVAAVGLLARKPDPSEEEIAAGLARNVCRCGTYPRIVTAVKQAARALRQERGGAR